MYVYCIYLYIYVYIYYMLKLFLLFSKNDKEEGTKKKYKENSLRC